MLLTLVTLFGCSTVGPSTISHGRADYNEAINRTDDEQLLILAEELNTSDYGTYLKKLVIESY